MYSDRGNYDIALDKLGEADYSRGFPEAFEEDLELNDDEDFVSTDKLQDTYLVGIGYALTGYRVAE